MQTGSFDIEILRFQPALTYRDIWRESNVCYIGFFQIIIINNN